MERIALSDKTLSEEDVVAELRDGMTIGIGGWGARRKPMSIVRAILRSPITDLTVVAFGGPDVGLLCSAGKVRKVVYGFVSLDSIPLEPHFRAARQDGTVEAAEFDEGMFMLGLQAAAWRVPFLPTRAGLGTDLFSVNPLVGTVRSPFADGETLAAVPAIPMDVAILHQHRGDRLGNTADLGPDPYFDDLFARAADRCFVSCEEIVATDELASGASPQALRISRLFVDGIVSAPNGAHFTSCAPFYGRDEAFQKDYALAARDPELWSRFRATYLDVSEADYQKAVIR